MRNSGYLWDSNVRHRKQQKKKESRIYVLLSFPRSLLTMMKISSFRKFPAALKFSAAKIWKEYGKEKKYWFETDGRLFSDAALEVMVTDHCNQSCRTCDHFAPLMTERFEDPETLLRDLTLLCKSVSFRKVKLIGGEPLMHPQIEHIVHAVRKSGICEEILLITNGTLFSRISDELLEGIDEIEISQYPGRQLAKTDMDILQRRAASFSTTFRIFYYPTFQNQFSFQGTSDKELIQSIFALCKRANLWGCHAVYEKHLFRCPQSIYLFKVIPELQEDPFADGLLITPGKSFKKQVLKFFTGKKPLKSCKYCLGTVGSLVNHEQVKKENWLNYQNETTKSLVDRDLLKLPVTDMGAHFRNKKSKGFEFEEKLIK